MAPSVKRRIVRKATKKKVVRKRPSPLQGGCVPPGAEPKSGCLWCPLFPWSEDFDDFAESYQRDAAKIQEKEKDGHTVVTRCVAQVWSGVDVLIVGEFPGRDEDKQATPFAGGPGGMLKKTLQHATGLSLDRVGFTHIVGCRPPRNRKPNKTEMRSCAPRLLREIEVRKPKVIVVLGNVALEFLTGQTGITTLCGKVLSCALPEFAHIPVVACMHPAYVLRQDHELDRFVEALQTAENVLEGRHEELLGLGTYDVLTTVEEVEELLDGSIEQGLVTSFDTETGSISPFQSVWPALLCFSFSNTAGRGWVVPYDHAESPFKDTPSNRSARKRVTAALRRFFESDLQKTAQNEKFDRNHIREAIGVSPRNVRDTMLMLFVLNEQRGTHGLKQLAFTYTGMGGYEADLERFIDAHPDCDPDRDGSYANIPGDVLFPYAAMDADVTLRVDAGLLAEPDLQNNERFQRLAFDFYPALSESLAEVEFEGAQIDPKMVAFLDKRYSGEMARVSKDIHADEMVTAFVADRIEADPKKFEGKPFNPESSKQLQEVLFGYYGLHPRELTDGGLSRLKARLEKRLHDWEAKRPRVVKNKPRWDKLVLEAIDNQEWDYFSTKADVLQDYDREGNPLVKKVLEHRGYSTLHGTFIKPLKTRLDDALRVHGTFLPHGTVTARLASRAPNLQNIPNKGGKLVKRCYVSRFGDEGVLVQADYSQIELRVAACFFNEPTMIRAYRNGEDLHTLTAIAISKLTAKKFKALKSELQGQWRVRAKRVNFGVLYGGGASALVNTLRKDGVFITSEEAQALIDAYFEARPALKQGMDRLEREVRKLGYLESFTGHRRRIPEVFASDERLVARALRQSINFPIQCGAAQMTNMSMILVNRELKARGFRSRLVLTVHDSLVLDCHVDEFVEVATICKETMESIMHRSDEVLPGLDWSWLTVPIVSDLEVGFDWGTLVPLAEAKLGDEERELDIYDLDVDYLWAAMEEKLAA